MSETRKSKCDTPTHRRLINVEPLPPGEREPLLDNFAAEVADAAYKVALRHGVGDKWLDLQLDLWGALTEAIKKRSRLQAIK